MDRPPDWRDWLGRGVLVAASLLGGAYLVSRARPAPAARPSVTAPPPPTEERLAEDERLVTVLPPKTRETFVTALKAGKLGPCLAMPDDGEVWETTLEWLRRNKVRANLFVEGRAAHKVQLHMRAAARSGHTVGSLGFRRQPPAVWGGASREAQDRSFKAANRAFFLATGHRPRFFLWEATGPVQDVVDTAAINGLLTVCGPAFVVLEPEESALDRWLAGQGGGPARSLTLDDALPLPKARGLGPHGGQTTPER